MDILSDLSGIWALETRYYSYAKHILLLRLEAGLPLFDESLRVKSGYHAMDADGKAMMFHAQMRSSSGKGGKATQAKKTAVIPVIGALTKRGNMCSYGVADYSEWFANAQNDSSVGSIVLHLDGPGGNVDGVPQFAEQIANSNKPVVGFVDGMAASAHYWLASQSNKIMMSHSVVSSVGSIGVLAASIDQSGMLEKQGIKVEIIRASKSVDKARYNGIEPLTDELKAQYIQELDAVNESFISAVKAGRPQLSSTNEDVFTGKLYGGNKAIALGMADEIGNLTAAIELAQQLSIK